jgi:hypothetical protein
MEHKSRHSASMIFFIIITTLLYAIFAFNSSLSLYKYTTTIANFSSPYIVQTILSVYGRYIWPIFLFTTGGVLIYIIIQGAKNDGFLLPIWAINNTNQSLKIYICDHFIGPVEPGKRIQNNHLPPLYRNYIIEAKDDHGNVLCSREFSRRDLIEMNGKVDINGSNSPASFGCT